MQQFVVRAQYVNFYKLLLHPLHTNISFLGTKQEFSQIVQEQNYTPPFNMNKNETDYKNLDRNDIFILNIKKKYYYTCLNIGAWVPII